MDFSRPLGRRKVLAAAGLLAALLGGMTAAGSASAQPSLPPIPGLPGGGACTLNPTNGTETKYMLYGFDYPRSYRIHVPAGLSGTAPLLVSLHDSQYGGTGSSSAHETRTGWTPYSDQKKFIVAYPDGNNGAFNPMDGAPDAQFLRALVTEIGKSYCLDTKRVFIEGQFLGGSMAEKMMCVAGDVYAAAALVNVRATPDTTPNCAPSRPMSVAVLQPEADTLPFIYGASVEEGKGVRDRWIQRSGCSTNGTQDSNPYGAEGLVYGGCSAGAGVLWRTYAGAGHTYPTGAALDDLHDKAWAFLMAHPRP